jgi:hypothetical protein
MSPGRGEQIFVFVFTTVIVTIVGLWLAWVRETGRWELFALFSFGLGFVIWKFWDYRPPS